MFLGNKQEKQKEMKDKDDDDEDEDNNNIPHNKTLIIFKDSKESNHLICIKSNPFVIFV